MTIEMWQFIIGILVIICGLVGTALRVGFVVASAISKINEQMSTMKAEFNALLELREAENGKAIGRVYQRFDEYKGNIESRFVSKEMCNVLHASSSATMISLEKKIDELVKKVDAILLRGK